MPANAAVYGCQGTELLPDERAFFRDAGLGLHPVRAQLRRSRADVGALCAALRETVGTAAPILIDQEGGRVARLRPPHWRARPPAAPSASYATAIPKGPAMPPICARG